MILALALSLTLSQLSVKQDGGTVGPVNAVNCVGPNVTCTKTGSTWQLSASGSGGISDGAWTTATYGAGWSSYDATRFPVAGYQKTGIRVHLRGLVAQSGGTTVVFTLPSGYYPPDQGRWFLVASNNNTFALVRVHGSGSATPGAVEMVSGSATIWIDLGSIDFDTP